MDGYFSDNLKTDFMQGRVTWVNNSWKDWWIMQKNTHPFIALCLVHPLHPFSRGERIAILWLEFTLLLLIASAQIGLDLQFCRVHHDTHLRHVTPYNKYLPEDYYSYSGKHTNWKFSLLAGSVLDYSYWASDSYSSSNYSGGFDRQEDYYEFHYGLQLDQS